MANYKRRFDACLPRPTQEPGKVYWHRIGRAFENDRGMINIYLDSLPIANADGVVQISLFEPKDDWGSREEPKKENHKTAPKGKAKAPADDDEIPWR